MQKEKKISRQDRLFLILLLVVLLLCFIIRLLDGRLDRFPHLPDKGPAWYYWQLPRPSLVARLTAWGGYLLHQVLIWGILFKARKSRKDSPGAERLNIAALLVNGSFILLHLLQTHLFYDGLAQDLPVWSSQYSVILMLVLILIMLMPRRGLFWGRKIRLHGRTRGFFRKFHSFYISWALIYTFWFHPMEGDFAILLGFLYMFLLFIQLSLFNISLHRNIYWITLLEVFVTFHGVAVAFMNGQAIWPMFLFGFLFMFILTQMHGLGLPLWLKIVLILIYGGGLCLAYAYRGWERLYELTFIPGILYGLAGVLVLLVSLFTRLSGKKETRPESESVNT